jgi:hypothetical protein
MDNRLLESEHESDSVTLSVREPTVGTVITPLEVYRGTTIRRIEHCNSPIGEQAGKYFCVVCGVILKDDASIESLKKKINDEFSRMFPSLPSAF